MFDCVKVTIFKIHCNKYLTLKLLTATQKALPLHPVLSFSVINYVVSMRPLRVSDDVSFSFYITCLHLDQKAIVCQCVLGLYRPPNQYAPLANL